jgi:hypothetical protein
MILNGLAGWRNLGIRKAGRFQRKSPWRNPNLRYFVCPPSNGGRSSMVEPRIVVPDVAGSNPVGHPPNAYAALRGRRCRWCDGWAPWRERPERIVE